MKNDGRIRLGFAFFVVFCCIPALSFTGFMPMSFITLPVAIVSSLIGGLVGGLILGKSSKVGGAIAGLIAGPLGLLGVYLYTTYRDNVLALEIAAIQCLASSPGLLIYYFFYTIPLNRKTKHKKSPSD